MKLDSVHQYSKEKCKGKIKRYSLPHIALAIDSMSCEANAYNYTYYLLSEIDFIQVVYTKKGQTINDPTSNSSYLIQEEKILDFNSDPPILMIKKDTITDSISRPKTIDKAFKEEILQRPTETYHQIKLNYHQVWQINFN